MYLTGTKFSHWVLSYSLVLHILLQSFKDHFNGAFLFSTSVRSRFLESGCKITAFIWHDQIFQHFFRIFFVTCWFSRKPSVTRFRSFQTLTCAYRENGRKITAFIWHDQIFSHFFSILFVTHWFSTNPFVTSLRRFVTLACVFRENGCKITAFTRHDQIFVHFFCTFFIMNWKSVM